MTTNDLNIDELPPHTLVVDDGQVAQLTELVLARVARDLIAACRQADDPQAVLKKLPELIAKHVAEIVSRRGHVESGPLRTTPSSPVGSKCLERRPDRDPLTGDRMDAQPDTDGTWPDRMPCTQQHGHNGDRSDALGRAWRRAEASA
ncbi:hypothetical protein [Streptomyces triticisoli]|uniref:hypothetical protein n=1 Tax=Streptomyces triticisoli TaxID=2182797 RepID=UPI000DD6D2D6|nr:hypothetical protein [Streptomyces triticisoli]